MAGTSPDSTPTSAELREHFDSTWLRYADRLEAQLVPVDPVLLQAASLNPRERVLDVGCGRGPTTVKAASAVGRYGRVVGIDLAPSLIAAARRRRAGHGGAPIDWVVGDAQTYGFDAASFDAVISRFGALFFQDPVAGFANLRAATRPGGRLTMVVWQPRDASELMQRSLDGTLAVARREGHDLQLPAPDEGPFAFGVEATMRAVLDEAGWVEPSVTRHVVEFLVGGPGCTPQEATAIGFAAGPLSALARDAPPELRTRMAESVAADLARSVDDRGIVLSGGIAIVAARCRG